VSCPRCAGLGCDVCGHSGLAPLDLGHGVEPPTGTWRTRLEIDGRTVAISPRRLQVFAHYLRYGGGDAAARLGITTQAIKNHAWDLYVALDAHSLTEAAIKLGWLRIPDQLLTPPHAPTTGAATEAETGDGRAVAGPATGRVAGAALPVQQDGRP